MSGRCPLVVPPCGRHLRHSGSARGRPFFSKLHPAPTPQLGCPERKNPRITGGLFDSGGLRRTDALLIQEYPLAA